MPNFTTDLAYDYFECPIGPLLIAGNEQALHLISFPVDRYQERIMDSWVRDGSPLTQAFKQLSAYFALETKEFDVELEFSGTAFQRSVWRALLDIPFGQTISYGELAKRIGNPNASRAVGAANGANHLPIIVPCHRVIGADNSLTGFGGGLPTKQFLLAHEGITSPQTELF
ncbi:MAG: methylated-DNA--[protein]-cysteine S-methyltransferase [Hyphomicrobiales bacterium]